MDSAAFLVCVVYLVLTKMFEKSPNGGPEKRGDVKLPCCILNNLGPPRRGLGGLWGPLGRRWALLARLLALLGVFGGVSGVVLGAIGQEA